MEDPSDGSMRGNKGVFINDHVMQLFICRFQSVVLFIWWDNQYGTWISCMNKLEEGNIMLKRNGWNVFRKGNSLPDIWTFLAIHFFTTIWSDTLLQIKIGLYCIWKNSFFKLPNFFCWDDLLQNFRSLTTNFQRNMG